MLDVKKIRAQFPLLKRKLNGKPIIYLDNACMTLKPLPVINAILEYYTDLSACGGRSVHKLAAEVTMRCDETREKVRAFLNAESAEECVLTKNTTEAINIVANGFGLKRGDIVLTTDREHNSNLVPWHLLAERCGVRHEVVRSNEDNTFSVENFKAKLRSGVRLVSMAHISNLDGYEIPAREIIELTHDRGATVLLDGAQSAPHKPIDVKKLDVDFFAFSIHKMCGPTGVGVLYGKARNLKNLAPVCAGGETVEHTTYTSTTFLKPPKLFEAGLQNYSGIIASGAAIDFLTAVGLENVAEHETELNRLLSAKLAENPRIKLYGPGDPALRTGICLFNLEGINSHDVAIILDETKNIMVRSGYQCAHSWFHARKIDGAVRTSIYLYNTEAEIKLVANELLKLAETLR